MKHHILLFLSILSFAAMRAESVSSPDGNIAVDFSLDDGKPTYSIRYKSHPSRPLILA